MDQQFNFINLKMAYNWFNLNDGCLSAGRCKKCEFISFPQRHSCPKCLSTNTEVVNLSQEGTLYASTVIRKDKLAPGQLKTPYVTGYVNLPEGIRIKSLIDVPIDKLRPNMPLTFSLKKTVIDSVEHYSFCFTSN